MLVFYILISDQRQTKKALAAPFLLNIIKLIFYLYSKYQLLKHAFEIWLNLKYNAF